MSAPGRGGACSRPGRVWSADGEQSSWQIWAAAAKFSAVAGLPRRWSSAAAHVKWAAPTAVSPMPQSRTAPSASNCTNVPAAATAQSPARRSTFSYALPAPARIGTRTSTSISAGPTTVSYGPSWNSRHGTVRLPLDERITIVALSAAPTADRSSDGSAWQNEPPIVPRLRTIGSAMTRLGFGEDAVVLGEHRRRQQRRMASHRPDGDLPAVHADVVEVGERVDVDQHLGAGEAELHHRQQAVAAGHDPRLGAVLLEQRECVIHGRGALVFERRRCLHGSPHQLDGTPLRAEAASSPRTTAGSSPA